MSKLGKIELVIILASALATFVASKAYAQMVLEEIVVTAQKRAESIQDVAVSMDAFTGEDLRSRHLVSILDLDSLSTNVSVKPMFGSSFPVITIRGVGFNNFASNHSSAAAVHVDEIYLGSPALLGFQMFDLERIEVLKGPQGTLYGRNTTSGTLNFVSAKPTREFEGYVNASYGRFDTTRIETAVSGPLTEQLAGRLAVAYDKSDGYMKNKVTGERLGGQDVWFARGQLDFQATERVDVLLKISGGKDDSEVFPHTFSGVICDGVFDPANLPLYSEFRPECTNGDAYSDSDRDPHTGDYIKVLDYDNSAFGATLTVNFDGPVRVTSITGYDRVDRNYVHKFDGSPFRLTDQLYDEAFRQVSQELRFASNETGPIDWIVGLYAANEKLDFFRDAYLTFGLFPTLLGLPAGFFPPDTFLQFGSIDNEQETKSQAVFGDLRWHAAELWTVDVGLRYTSESKDYLYRSWVTMDPAEARPLLSRDKFMLGMQTLNEKLDKTWDDVSGKVGLEFRPEPGLLWYLTLSRGFKSGGFNSGMFATSVDQVAPYDPETLNAVELGVKSTLLEGAMQLNAAVFYYDYQDKQELLQLIRSPTDILNIVANAGSVDVMGIEASLNWLVTEHLQLEAGVGWIDSEIKEWEVQAAVSAVGNTTPMTPEVSLTLRGSYDLPLGNDSHLRLTLDAAYQDQVYFSILNEPWITQSSYWLTNGSLAWTSPGGRLQLSLWARNLLDEDYRTYATDASQIGFNTLTYAAPRTYGVGAEYRF